MTIESKQATLADPLEPEQIAGYLRDHPDFFIDYRDLLADMTLPHETGAAVSLVERQVSILRERNIDMRNRLSKLLDNARENDKLFDKTKRLLLSLLEGQDFGDIVDALYYSFDKEFHIDVSSLILFGNPDKIPSSQARIVPIADARKFIGPLIKNNRAICGVIAKEEIEFLFAGRSVDIGSVAAVPLVHGSAFGVLAVGNKDPHYYRSSMGTLFLGYIAEVLNRLLPKYLPR